MSINWHLDVEPAPALLVLPPAAASLDEAHAAIELWEHYSRKTLDPVQRLTVEVMMATTTDDRWAAATTGREMPRQNGKGDELEVVELWGLTQRSEAILHTVHDAVLLASQAQQRMLGVLEGHPDLRRLVKRKWQGTGQQMIEMRNGGIIWYRTRTGGGGRGVDDVDRLVVDEAQHATEEQISAVAPTLLANPNPQMNAVGTAGLEGRSAWWWSVRKRALSDDPGAFGYVGHTAERLRIANGRIESDPVDVADRTLWAAVNPSVLAGRGGGMDFLEEQFRRIGPDAFGREHLCIWDPEPTMGGGTVPMDTWQACRGDVRPIERGSFALDVSPDSRSASICVSDGEYVEIVKHGPGTDWVVPLVKTKGVEVWVDPTGPASALVGDLDAAGVTVHKVGTQQATGAAQSFLTAVTEGRLVHIGQSVLDAAVANAGRRDIGDGGWLWSRRKSSVDISPLVAATLARWAAVSAPDPKVEFQWL